MKKQIYLIMFILLITSVYAIDDLGDLEIYSKYEYTTIFLHSSFSDNGTILTMVYDNNIVKQYPINQAFNLSTINKGGVKSYVMPVRPSTIRLRDIQVTKDYFLVFDRTNLEVSQCYWDNYDLNSVTSCDYLDTPDFTPTSITVYDNRLFVTGTTQTDTYTFTGNVSESVYIQTDVIGRQYIQFLTNKYFLGAELLNTTPMSLFYLTNSLNLSSFEIISNFTLPYTATRGISLTSTPQNHYLTVSSSITSPYNRLMYNLVTTNLYLTNIPPNTAYDIQPSNTTITLNSTGVNIPINWSGGDDNNSDIVTTRIYLNLLGDKTYLKNTTLNQTTVTLNNSLLTNNFYTIWLNLSDNKNYTISEGNYFRLCVNDWEKTISPCENNLQTTVYKDLNNCPETYDIPINNGTINACGLLYGELDINKKTDYQTIIIIIFLTMMVSLSLMSSLITIHFLTMIMFIVGGIYFYHTTNNIYLLTGFVFGSLLLLFRTIKNN